MDLQLPKRLRTLAADIDQVGGRIFLVGGSVRDHLLGERVKDYDLEVFGLEPPALEAVLARHGRINPVGRAFGVYKLACGSRELDISLPRRDSKVGPGHRGIAVQGDPSMSLAEAASRRDLTINALMWEINTGELHDLVGGEADLRAGLLRAVDAKTFLEDPLRALRVAQFAARLCFEVDPALEQLCRQADLHELPPERIQTEWVKLMLRGREPSRGLRLLRLTDQTSRIFPELADTAELDACVDRTVGRLARDPQGRRLALPLLVWLSETSGEGTAATLDRLAIFSWRGYPLRDRLLAAHHALREQPSSDADLRRLSTRAELRLWLGAQRALEQHPEPLIARWTERVTTLGISESAPPPLIHGRDLLALGMAPGPEIGALLQELYDRQLSGDLTTPEQARRAAQDALER